MITDLNRPIIPQQLMTLITLEFSAVEGAKLSCQASSIDTAAGFTFLFFTFIRLASICTELELGYLKPFYLEGNPARRISTSYHNLPTMFCNPSLQKPQPYKIISIIQ